MFKYQTITRDNGTETLDGDVLYEGNDLKLASDAAMNTTRNCRIWYITPRGAWMEVMDYISGRPSVGYVWEAA